MWVQARWEGVGTVKGGGKARRGEVPVGESEGEGVGEGEGVDSAAWHVWRVRMRGECVT